jgi:hypothetical protein
MGKKLAAALASMNFEPINLELELERMADGGIIVHHQYDRLALGHPRGHFPAHTEPPFQRSL